MRPLHPHQLQAVDMLRRSLGSGNRRPMLQAPTGFGKTMLGVAIVEGALRKGRRVIFSVPALSLIDQTVDAFWQEGIRDVGVIQGDHGMTNAARPIQVASVQTLERRSAPLADIVVLDEAHRWFKFYERWMHQPEWQKVPFVGLSATPWTRGLGKHFDDLIIAATTGELIERGYLSKFRVLAPSHPDLSKVRTVAGDFHEGDLADVMNDVVLVADIVETWRRHGENRPTLCFAVDRSHAKFLQARFEEAGIPCGYVDAYTDREEREAIRRRFHSGDLKVVCNVGCLTTGVDWDVRCIILARPTKSEMLFVQIIGRGLRTAEGKQDCLVLDHSDTHLRLGFVTDVHHDALDDGTGRGSYERKHKPPLPKECPSCRFLRPARVNACPACGFVPETQWAEDTEAGELQEFKSTKRVPTPEEKRSFFAQLKGYAAERQKSDKWVLANYREKFKEWPRNKSVLAEPPSAEVYSWVKSRQIAWAKARDRADKDELVAIAAEHGSAAA
jgi:DNA repair protein RadD